MYMVMNSPTQSNSCLGQRPRRIEDKCDIRGLYSQSFCIRMEEAPVKKKVPLQFPGWLLFEENTWSSNAFAESQLMLDRLAKETTWKTFDCRWTCEQNCFPHKQSCSSPGAQGTWSPGCQKAHTLYQLVKRMLYHMRRKAPGRVLKPSHDSHTNIWYL